MQQLFCYHFIIHLTTLFILYIYIYPFFVYKKARVYTLEKRIIVTKINIKQ